MRAFCARSVLVLAIVLTTVACCRIQDDRATNAAVQTTSIDDVLSQMAGDAGLSLVDLSVPFDRFDRAPATLEKLAANLSERVPGIYVMRYHDDTLRFTAHVFECGPEGIRYIMITSIAAGQWTREEHEISGVDFDAATSTLTLTSHTGSIQLSPHDVTPAGA